MCGEDFLMNLQEFQVVFVSFDGSVVLKSYMVQNYHRID